MRPIGKRLTRAVGCAAVALWVSGGLLALAQITDTITRRTADPLQMLALAAAVGLTGVWVDAHRRQLQDVRDETAVAKIYDQAFGDVAATVLDRLPSQRDVG